ncbi:hypothetical protein ACQKC1_16870 [Shewanella baltica]|uniref:hypothetical protein n=1 Tax=Shewanella baltica TaxID=62322 RepID=UPI003D08C7BF
MNIKTLELYKSVREVMNDTTTEASDISGFVDFDENIFAQLKQLNSEGLCSGSFTVFTAEQQTSMLTVEDELSPKHFDIYKRAKIELSKQSNQSSDFFICEDWNTLLSYSSYLFNPIKAVYFSIENNIISETKPDEKYKAYVSLTRICQLIKDVSHTSHGNNHIILCGQPLEISMNANVSMLMSDANIDFLDELLGKDQHKEAMYSLVREALYNLLSDLDVKSRLSHLITHFNAFISKLLVSYEQYVRNYSFDKVRKEYREKATQYIDKINKVFDDIATKTFSIPAGVWLATSQMESTAIIDSLQFIKNISYSFMVFFLVLVVSFNLLGQFSTLNAIVNEYTDLFKRLENELVPNQKIELNNLKQTLDTRNIVVFIKLVITMIFAFSLLGFTIFVAYKACSYNY